MPVTSRRDFLLSAVGGLAGLALGASAPAVKPEIFTFTRCEYPTSIIPMFIRPRLTPAQRKLVFQAIQKISQGLEKHPVTIVSGLLEDVSPHPVLLLGKKTSSPAGVTLG